VMAPGRALKQRFVGAARTGPCWLLDRGGPQLPFMLNTRPFDMPRARSRLARAAEAEDRREADSCCDSPRQSYDPCSRREVSLPAPFLLWVLLGQPVASSPTIMAHALSSSIFSSEPAELAPVPVSVITTDQGRTT
jgi:hypothetical protein